MKITFNRAALSAIVNQAAGVVPGKPPRPVLANLKIAASGDAGVVSATDLEISVQLQVRSLTVHEPGECLVPAARLAAVLREATDEELVLDAAPDSVTVNGAGGEWEMPTEDVGLFPDFPEGAKGIERTMPGASLREALRRTVFATSDEAGRYAMQGVLVEFAESVTRLVATDGRQLAVVEWPGDGETTTGTHVIPEKACKAVKAALDTEGDVRVVLAANEAMFFTDRATVLTRLVEGRYPKWAEVIPKKRKARVPLKVGAFLKAVRQALTMTDAESRRIMFEFGPDKCILRTKGHGKAKVCCPVEYDGEVLETALSGEYVTAFLGVLDPELTITMDFVDGKSPVLFRSGDSYRVVVMPLT